MRMGPSQALPGYHSRPGKHPFSGAKTRDSGGTVNIRNCPVLASAWTAPPERWGHGVSGVQFRQASGVKTRLRRGLAALLFGVGLAIAAVPAAHAQSTWNGTTIDYNDNNNWTPTTAPTAAGQSAIFDAGGTDTINVSAGIAPDSWTFTANSQEYQILGATVTFNGGGGIANNASGGFIRIQNVID